MIKGFLNAIEPVLLSVYRRLSLGPPPNLEGDRYIEYSWIASHISPGTGYALEVGCGRGYLALIAARCGFRVTAIDLTPVSWLYIHPNLNFIQTDLLDLNITPSSLDLIINCSTIEHIGLGRYGDKLNLNGDIEAMKLLRNLLKPGGIMLLTIPVGKDAVYRQLHRVYGPERLPRLLEGYVVEDKEYWIKDSQNRWIMVDEKMALNWRSRPSVYGLGCFTLRPP